MNARQTISHCIDDRLKQLNVQHQSKIYSMSLSVRTADTFLTYTIRDFRSRCQCINSLCSSLFRIMSLANVYRPYYTSLLHQILSIEFIVTFYGPKIESSLFFGLAQIEIISSTAVWLLCVSQFHGDRATPSRI